MNYFSFYHHHPLLHAGVLYMRERGVNFNTVILGLISGLLVFGGKELYSEIRLTHDSMIEMKKDLVMIRSEMVQKAEYEVEITSLKLRMATIEIDIQKLKNLK
jgi:hypothetical protein